jgi:hypothetical protein
MACLSSPWVGATCPRKASTECAPPIAESLGRRRMLGSRLALTIAVFTGAAVYINNPSGD